MTKIKYLILAILIAALGGFLYTHHKSTVKQNAKEAASVAKVQAAQKAATELASHCADNASGKNIIVSISKQHLWACSDKTVAYDTAVITGMESYPADLTPTGTYQIYARATNQTLAGSDNTGSWSDAVSYWMPFLDNQYGTYGFHDATWRAPADFGSININAPFTTTAKSASHGCIELTLSAAKWLYDWAPVNTSVTVQG